MRDMSILLGARRLYSTINSNVNAWYDAVIVGSGMVGGALSCALGESDQECACALIIANL